MSSGKRGGFLSPLRSLFGGPGKPSEEVAKILAAFRSPAGRFPEAAVRDAVARREEITPHLLEIVRATTRTPQETIEGEGSLAHVYALYLLAQFREKRAYPLVVAFARLPGTLTEDLLGDTLTEGLDRILASVSEGDLGPLKNLIEDPEANEWARNAGVDAIPVMVFNGLLDRQEAVDYFRHLLTGGLRRKASEVWNGLATAATDLHPAELLDGLRTACADGLVNPGTIGLPEIEEAASRDRDAWLAERRQEGRGLIDDCVEEMSGWACFQEDAGTGRPEADEVDEEPPGETYVREQPKIGRNEPCPCGSGKKYKKCCGKA